MKRIMLTKYGFVRSPEDDFSDDGNYFTCYKVGNVRVSKLVADGDAYISATLDGQLPYDQYSKLSYYRELDRLNGVPASTVTEEDIQRLYEACISYEKEYNDALKNVVFPTLEQLKAHAEKLNAVYVDHIIEIEHLLREVAPQLLLTAPDYEFKNLKSYYKSLTTQKIDEEYLKRILNTAYSISWLTQDPDTWYYQQCKEILAKY